MVLRLAYDCRSAGKKVRRKWTIDYGRTSTACTVTSKSQRLRNSQRQNKRSILIWWKNWRRCSRVAVDWWWLGFQKKKKNITRPCIPLYWYWMFIALQTWSSNCNNSGWRNRKFSGSRTLRLLYEKIASKTVAYRKHCFYACETKLKRQNREEYS